MAEKRLKQIFIMEEKIYNLQKENKLLKLQLLHLSEDIELMYERMEKLERKLKEKRVKNPYMKIVSPER
jgi:hypothetical protein|nr:MAG: hypothetical protein [Bacteriophage sp.]